MSTVKVLVHNEVQTANQEALVDSTPKIGIQAEIKEHQTRAENAMKIRIGGLPDDWFKKEDFLRKL